jgi:hypothetical protein
MLLIGGNFLLTRLVRTNVYIMPNLPKDKEYLKHYFKSILEKAFLAYWLSFSHIKQGADSFYINFVDHTGFFCDKKTFLDYLKRVETIEKMYYNSQQSMDLELVQKIVSGKLFTD